MASLSSRGQSDSSKQMRARAKALFDLFRASDTVRAELFHAPFEELGEEVACSTELYSGFAKFIMDEYMVDKGASAGRHLACGTALDYLGALLNLAAAKFKAVGRPSTRMFFTCLDVKATTDEAEWLRGLKNNLIRADFERRKEAGEELDTSVTPIYSMHVQSMIKALMIEGSAEVST